MIKGLRARQVSALRPCEVKRDAASGIGTLGGGWNSSGGLVRVLQPGAKQTTSRPYSVTIHIYGRGYILKRQPTQSSIIIVGRASTHKELCEVHLEGKPRGQAQPAACIAVMPRPKHKVH
jgi:hypothetical protein